nr:hypothetical protein CFP56_04068 [Quercus suber]
MTRRTDSANLSSGCCDAAAIPRPETGGCTLGASTLRESFLILATPFLRTMLAGQVPYRREVDSIRKSVMARYGHTGRVGSSFNGHSFPYKTMARHLSSTVAETSRSETSL